MAHIPERDSREFSENAYDEDTLELEPLSEQKLSSLRTAEESHVTAIVSEPHSLPPPVLAVTATAAQTRGSWPVHGRLLMTVAGVLALSALAKWAMNRPDGDVGLAAPVASSKVPHSDLSTDKTPEAAPPAIAATQAITPPVPAVRFRNPFDASEVFEFPPGTTQMEAWDAVRETLLRRARERRTASESR